MITQEMTFLEKVKGELVFDLNLKKPVTGRTSRLREATLMTKPKIYTERAVLLTQSMKETEGQPMVLRRAKALAKILSEMKILIWPDELIVGNQAPERRAAPTFPEFDVRWLIEELDGKPIRPERRPGDKFIIDEKEELAYREIVRWWQGKTVEEYKINLMPNEVIKASFEQNAFYMSQGAAGGIGHFVPGYHKVLSKGLLGIIKEAEEELNKLELWNPEDFEKRYFLEAVILTLQAAIGFAKRFSFLAMEMAKKEVNDSRKKELEQIAQNCHWVPANPPRTFWEAMQSIWLTHLIIQIESNGHSISFGRFDQYMYPFYESDINTGRVNLEEVLELIECLWIKSMEINKIRPADMTQRATGYPMFQNLTLGGQTRDGGSAINDLSWLALEATANLKLPSPSISVRCWNGMPESFLLKCLEVINIHRGGQPALFNDEAIIPTQLGVGVPIEEAYDYAISSCVQPCQPGKGMKIGLFVTQSNMLKILEMTLNNGKDPRSGIQINPNLGNKDLSNFESFEELVTALKRQLEFYHRLNVSAINCIAKAFAELLPTPFVSALMDDCISRARDLQWGGGRYNSAGLLQIGMANVGNSLAALKKIMFEQKRLSTVQIRHALNTNFEDNTTVPTGEEIRQILLGAPKYGNDDDYADLLLKEIFEFACRDITKYVVHATGARCTTNTASVAANVPFGAVCGATLDGRKASTPTNEGISPVQGTDSRGPTATLLSVAKINHALCAGGTLLNQKFSPIAFGDLEQLAKISSLVRTFFSLKGMQIQFNIVSADTLREAQRHPEKYPNLLVRVAGYSALFTELDPEVQNDIISRTEQGGS